MHGMFNPAIAILWKTQQDEVKVLAKDRCRQLPNPKKQLALQNQAIITVNCLSPSWINSDRGRTYRSGNARMLLRRTSYGFRGLYNMSFPLQPMMSQRFSYEQVLQGSEAPRPIDRMLPVYRASWNLAFQHLHCMKARP